MFTRFLAFLCALLGVPGPWRFADLEVFGPDLANRLEEQQSAHERELAALRVEHVRQTGSMSAAYDRLAAERAALCDERERLGCDLERARSVSREELREVLRGLVNELRAERGGTEQ